jgi:biopolymer transport protein ExbD/biopolymer transport protein TolR
VNFRRATPRPDVQINTTAMVDVLFNLVFYFMLTSTFVERPLIRVDLPQVEAEALRPEPGEVRVWVAAEGEVWVGDAPVDEAGLRAALRAAAADPEAIVVLEADVAAAHGVVVWIMDVARVEGVARFAIATESPARP